jgi:hypothetical protein
LRYNFADGSGEDGYRIMIFTDDHEPAHVHVFKAGCVAIFLLNCPAAPPSLRERSGFSFRESNRIEKLLTRHLDLLCEAWKELHGNHG